jgi:hypothetical protein
MQVVQSMRALHALGRLPLASEHTNALHVASRRGVIPLAGGTRTPLRQFHKCSWRRLRLARSARRSSERASCIIKAA